MNTTDRRVLTSSLPRVAVVGRPNVGKSTLLNRFVGRREAIVEEKPGVTRDRREETADWCGRRFVVIDTGGWMSDPADPVDAAVRDQVAVALAQADVILFVVDAQAGISQEDAEAAKLVRRAGVPCLLVANKVDNEVAEMQLADLYALGVGDPLPVSALHGRRSGDLLDAVVAALPDEDEDGGPEPDELAEASVALVGRPNVGKSTLFNRLCGDERSIVHDAPGTTRDAVDTVVSLDGVPFRFVDTAGLRRKARVDDRTEYYSRVRAIQSLERADVALLVIDATAGITTADQKVAEEIVDAGRAAVVLLNKWDLLGREEKLSLADDVEDKLRFIAWAPVLRISARTGYNVVKLRAVLDRVLTNFRRRVPTADLVRTIEQAQAHHTAPMVRGATSRIRYATQARHSPPTFVLFANRRLGPDYVRFIENRLRDAYDFEGAPLRCKVKVSERQKKR